MDSTEEKLASTLQALEQLKAQYNEFVYIVSHDLSSSFRTTSGVLEIILKNDDNSLDARTKKHLEIVLNEAQKGSEILAALLEYSRINTQAEPFEMVATETLVEEVLDELSDLVNGCNAQISMEALPCVFADRKQLRQLFYHLLKNALTYRRKDAEVVINIAFNTKDGTAEFTIQDNGIGIKASHVDKIFQVLRRGVTQNQYAGSGMGLAVAKKILHRHAGDIWVESEPDEGSRFYFTLPISQQNER